MKNMCFAKLFRKKLKPPDWPHSNKVALLFGINDYRKYEHNLRGCINDIKLAASRLPGFQIRMFKDKEVTKANFAAQIKYALDNAQPDDIIYIHYSGHGTYCPDRNGDEADGFDEALYLYDGIYIDDDMNHCLRATPEGVTVVLLLDSCFSGTATRRFTDKRRFMPPKKDIEQPKEHVRIKRKFYDYMSWVALSGCAENETSCDALINGVYNGAFTYFAMHTLLPDMTYKTWHQKIREFLPSRDFDQSPTIEGPDALVNKKVFTVEKK